MFGQVRLYDYRCFFREYPATLHVSKGFTSFIGPNNAGKSALLRSLYELRSAFRQLQVIAHNPLAVVTNPFALELVPPLSDRMEVVSDRNDPRCAIELLVESSATNDLTLVRARLDFSAEGEVLRWQLFGSDDEQLIPGEGRGKVSGAINGAILLHDGRQVQTQAMSSLLDALIRVQYVGAFRNAINEGSGAHFDVQVGTGFIAQWHTWKAGASKAQNRAIQQVTEDVRRLVGARTLEVTASVELKTLQVIVNGRPYKLSELGSGISQLIVVLGNALISRPSFIAIDEPETHLHPSLQADFLTSLAKYAEHGILFSTHSIGLARSNADRCFSVQATERGSLVRLFERTPRYAEFLGSLGIAALQDIGWNRILLVEGPTDVRTFQYLLRLYEKDRKTITLPLGGDSMINGKVEVELAEILRFGCEVIAIIDSERESPTARPMKSRADFAELCGKLGIRCCVTERRATENYMNQRALSTVFGDRHLELGHFSKAGSNGEFWGKSENWRVAQALTKDELDGTDIGRFLESLRPAPQAVTG